MHYYERNIGDYYKKAGRLNILQHGVYTLLIDACYDREQFPTLEEAIDWVWAETDEEIEAVKFVLRKFFKPDGNGVYVQHHIEQDLIAYQEFLDKQTENGKKGGRPKKTTDSQELAKETQNNPLETQNNPIKPKQSLNQEPITNNQEPINNNNKREENFQKSEQDFIDKVTTDNRKTFPITFDWKPNDSQFGTWCQRRLITPNQLTKEIFDGFVDKAVAKGEVKTEAQWCELLSSYLKTCLDNPIAKKPNLHVYKSERFNQDIEPPTNDPAYKPFVPLTDEEKTKTPASAIERMRMEAKKMGIAV